MEFKTHTLDNGLTVVGEINKAAKSAAVGFFVKTGARDETLDINGVSHFLEHMLFKGNDRYDAFEVSQAFDDMGAKFNAFTSEENTVYYAAVLPEYLEQAARLWMSLMRPSLRTDDFNIEKNVIKEEIAMYQDLPMFDVLDSCRNLHFDGHPCGNSVLGTVESIDGLTDQQMRQYFDRRYAPNNMALVVAGNVQWQKICAAADELCEKWQHMETERQITDASGSGKTKRKAKPNLVREHICLMSKAVSAQDPQKYAAVILANIIGDSRGSRYYWEIVDKALAETAVMEPDTMDGTGEFFTYIRCGEDKAEQVMTIVNKILKDIEQNGVTDAEIEKARNKILGAMVLKNELPMGRLLDLGLNWNYLGKYIPIDDDIQAIRQVTAGQVHELARQCNISRYTRYSVGPAEK